MKTGDLVTDPTGYHKGIGIIKGVHEVNPHITRLWVLWLHGEHPYSTGCRPSDVEKLNERG